ncbi:MAG: hypothetical protein ACKD6N_00395 [Candidatus Bathyarchaeota archaeon]
MRFVFPAETLTEEVVEKLKKKPNLTCKFVKLEKVGRRIGNSKGFLENF